MNDLITVWLMNKKACFYFWINDKFQRLHKCRFKQIDVMNFDCDPKCTSCGMLLSEASE